MTSQLLMIEKNRSFFESLFNVTQLKRSDSTTYLGDLLVMGINSDAPQSSKQTGEDNTWEHLEEIGVRAGSPREDKIWLIDFTYPLSARNQVLHCSDSYSPPLLL